MKQWTLNGRIILASLSYILSLIMFMNTSAFNYASFKTSLITVNVIAFSIIVIGFGLSKNILTPTFFVCMGLCVPSLMTYSKLADKVFEVNVENNFNAFITSIFLLAVISMLLMAEKLKKAEKEYDALISSGAGEETVKFITINSLKVYLSFLAGIVFLTFIVTVVGVAFLNIKGSLSIAIITATLGITIFLGCVYYISQKWTKE